MTHRHDWRPYKPVSPEDKHIIGGLHLPTPPTDTFGLHSRADIMMDAETIERRLEAQQPGSSIEDFQYWAETNWKTVHGTYDSTERFSKKLREEYREAIKALHELQEMGDTSTDPDQHLVDHFASELGDILWCMSAFASNGAAGLDAGIKIILHDYVTGTHWVRDGESIPPSWRAKAIEISTKWEKISITDIDELIAEGFEPGPSPVMNVYDPDTEEYEVEEHLESHLGAILLAAVQVQTSMQYGRRDTDDETEPSYVMQATFNAHAVNLAGISGAAILEIAYIAKKSLNMSLAEIIAKNVSKISRRVESGRVDKTDGDRDGQLL